MSLKSINCYDQGFRFNNPVEIRKQNALEEAEGPEPEPKERAMAVLKLTEGLCTD
jgi:DNA-binding winged helix-turn-helix (wHTH) protein